MSAPISGSPVAGGAAFVRGSAALLGRTARAALAAGSAVAAGRRGLAGPRRGAQRADAAQDGHDNREDGRFLHVIFTSFPGFTGPQSDTLRRPGEFFRPRAGYCPGRMKPAGGRAGEDTRRAESAASWRNQGQRLSRARLPPPGAGGRVRTLPSARESCRRRRGMARAATPDHRAQERAGRRHRPGSSRERRDHQRFRGIEKERVRKNGPVSGRSQRP